MRATNAEGDSDWSASGSGTTNAATTAPTVGAVWSGTLTVRDSLGSLGCSNGFSGSYCSDYLSDDDFTYDSTDYAITTLWVLENGRLQFIFDTVPVLTSTETLALALTLNLDGTAFAFEDADSKGVDFRRWNNSGLSWTVGATVSATVTVTGTTAPTNNVPVFNPVAVSRSVAENTAAGENVGDPVTATDADTGDTLTYTLGGTDAASFDIVAASGQVQTKTGVTYDHEAKASYAVTVTASDGTATADATVTISVTDVAEPPTAPAAPAVAGVSGSTTSLMVSWTAPGNTGKPAIASYDVQYRQGTSGAFTNGPQDVNGTSATITGLTADTLYQVQVRATNDEGDSGWSASGSGTTADPPGVTVSPSALTVAEGTTVPYTVRLNSRPTGTVTVTPSSDNPAVTFSPATLTFTASTWATEQTVTVTAAQDTAEATATISHAVAGGGYGSVPAPSVLVTVPDDDTDPDPDPDPDPGSGPGPGSGRRHRR